MISKLFTRNITKVSRVSEGQRRLFCTAQKATSQPESSPEYIEKKTKSGDIIRLSNKHPYEKEEVFDEILAPSNSVRSLGFNSDLFNSFDKYSCNLKNEIDLMEAHEKTFNRPRLGLLMNKVYIPKITTKFVAPFLYNDGENPQQLMYSGRPENRVFTSRYKNNKYILGIQTNFGNISLSLVNKEAKVASYTESRMFNHKNTFSKVSRDNLMEWTEETLQKCLKEVLKSSGLNYSKIQAIVVNLGPGEDHILGQGLQLAK